MEFVGALGAGALDEQKPSLFELVSEQQLSALLAPTLRYLVAVSAQRYPRRLLPLLNRFDEAYALCALVVERHFLRTRAATFTEDFYGLRRERALPGAATRADGHSGTASVPRALRRAAGTTREKLALSEADVWKNLCVVVLAPYLKRRLDEAHEIETN